MSITLIVMALMVETLLSGDRLSRLESRMESVEARQSAVKTLDEALKPSPEPGVYLLSDGEAAVVEAQQLAESRQRASGIAVRSGTGRRGSGR